MKPATSFTIDRQRWSRGGEGASLLDGDGHRCAVGFYLGACGVPDSLLRGKTYPAQLRPAPRDTWLMAGLGNSSAATTITEVNDDERLPEPLREARLVELFRRQDIELTFTDGVA